MIQLLADHLWQSTLFAAIAFLLTLAFRNNRAAVRHALWLAASLKFLLPFSLLIWIGAHFEWRTAPAVVHHLGSSLIGDMGQPFALPHPASLPSRASGAPERVPVFLLSMGILWFCGFAVNSLAWCRRSRRVRTVLRDASPLPLNLAVPVMSSLARLEPGVFGIRKPVLLLPDGILSHLTQAQLHAVLEHELCHVRRRDNLAAAIHMAVEALFWFHPLVWWIEARLIEERERACDEQVLQLTSDPQEYAEGILSVCKFYLESPLLCMSGVTGSNLRRRVETIMINRNPNHLGLARKVLLAIAATTAVAGPLVIGLLNAPPLRAQVPAAAAKSEFDVASVKQFERSIAPGAQDLSFVGKSGKPINIAGNRITMRGTLRSLIAAAYDIKDYQISAAPSWAGVLVYDVVANSPGDAAPTQDEVRPMFQALLADRFQLKLHRDTKVMPIYYLMPGKKAIGLKPAGPDEKFRWGLNLQPDGTLRSKATNESIGDFVQLVGASADRPVIDKTGVTGNIDYDILISSPEHPNFDDTNQAILNAVKDQLGLKLEPGKEPIELLVIDHADKPSEN
jgi:uncharacterized protein (TIGR03435 family)